MANMERLGPPESDHTDLLPPKGCFGVEHSGFSWWKRNNSGFKPELLTIFSRKLSGVAPVLSRLSQGLETIHCNVYDPITNP